MKYQDLIKGHLSQYKYRQFNNIANGFWRNKEYSHILPDTQKELNILHSHRELFYKSTLSKIKYHIYFHHLNSSQAMCINFFYPLIKEQLLDNILNLMGLTTEVVDYNTVQFEKNSHIEKSSRATSFDFFFKTDSGKNIYFEIKYTEQEFGKAKKDKVHFDKYHYTYKNHCSAINPTFCNQDSFLDHYQLMRNIIHVSENDYVVFVYPEDNNKIKNQVLFAQTNLIQPHFKKNVIALTWETLLNGVLSSNKININVKTQMKDFCEKYNIS